MAEDKGPQQPEQLYLVDEKGNIPPEIARIVKVNSVVRGLFAESSKVGDALTSLLDMSQDLGFKTENKEFRFPSESWAKGELETIAGFLLQLNYRIWGVTRKLSGETHGLTGKLQQEDDVTNEADLEEFLKSDPEKDPEKMVT